MGVREGTSTHVLPWCSPANAAVVTSRPPDTGSHLTHRRRRVLPVSTGLTGEVFLNGRVGAMVPPARCERTRRGQATNVTGCHRQHSQKRVHHSGSGTGSSTYWCQSVRWVVVTGEAAVGARPLTGGLPSARGGRPHVERGISYLRYAAGGGDTPPFVQPRLGLHDRPTF
jgi:hypothetical protein